jgi:AcrR family transcriptional regulator
MPSSDPPRRAPGRPARISRELIVAAAAASENLERLTMRDLAARLEVSHGALYRWVQNRDELLDLIGEVLVDRVLDDAPSVARGWRRRLAHIAWRMHDEFLAVPGYATHLSRPHRHNAAATERLHAAIVETLVGAKVDPALAEQAYYIFLTGTVSWIAGQEDSSRPGPNVPRFELFLDSLLRGLPPREPGVSRS